MARQSPYQAYIRLRRRREALLFFTAVYAVAAYWFLGLAFDSGSYWYYLGVFISIWAAIDSLVGALKHGKEK